MEGGEGAGGKEESPAGGGEPTSWASALFHNAMIPKGLARSS